MYWTRDCTLKVGTWPNFLSRDVARNSGRERRFPRASKKEEFSKVKSIYGGVSTSSYKDAIVLIGEELMW